MKNIIKGYCIGVADLIPGVSGGTVALILGIYTQLLNQVSLINYRFLSLVVRRDFGALKNYFDWGLLLQVALGLVLGVTTWVRILPIIFLHYSVYFWACLFGIVAASVIVLWRQTTCDLYYKVPLFFLGAAIGYVFLQLVPVDTPHNFFFLFLAGFVAIGAMVLPGISGSFVLLLLGKYETVISALSWRGAESVNTLLPFTLGLGIGLISTCKLLNHIYKKYPAATTIVMTGFIAGVLQKMWPWRNALEVKVVAGKIRVLSDSLYFPQHINIEYLVSLLIMLVAFMAVLWSQKLTKSI